MAAQEFSVGLALATTTATAYTVPAGKKARLLAVQVANTDASNAITGTVTWTDSSAAATYNFGKNIEIAAADSVGFTVGGIVLDEGDNLAAFASAATADLTVSLQEEDK